MGSAKRCVALSPLMSLALAVALSFWVLNAEPAQARRALRGAGPSQDDHVGFFGIPTDSSYGCGYYNSSAPQDANLPHQPCYGKDGVIDFCCLSGSSRCFCPLATGSELGCYNYEAGNTLNANTGDECGYFLPKATPSLRRQLAGCSCPASNQGPCAIQALTHSDVSGNRLYCQSGILTNTIYCDYANDTGRLITNFNCCPSMANGC